MIKEGGKNKFELKWKAIKYNKQSEECLEREYEKEKEKGKNLKEFIIEERAKDAKINLEFIIEGIDFGNWLNRNYYKDENAIGYDRFENNLTFVLNKLNYEEINFIYEKIGLKQILGQSISLDDCIDYYNSKEAKNNKIEEREEIIERSKRIKLEEDKDVILFCSACCGDRMCGYIGIQIYHKGDEIIWQMRLNEGITEFRFDKKSYLAEFREYIELINGELRKRGIGEVNIKERGKEINSIEEKIALLSLKFKGIRIDDLEKKAIMTVLKNGDEYEMDTIIILAKQQGIKEQKILKWIEEDYSKLSKDEKERISWRIIDKSEYYNNLDLNNTTLVKKASLIYK